VEIQASNVIYAGAGMTFVKPVAKVQCIFIDSTIISSPEGEGWRGKSTCFNSFSPSSGDTKGQSPFEKEYDLELQRRILSRKEGSGPEKPIYLPTTFV
jgi:hypothetical protein